MKLIILIYLIAFCHCIFRRYPDSPTPVFQLSWLPDFLQAEYSGSQQGDFQGSGSGSGSDSDSNFPNPNFAQEQERGPVVYAKKSGSGGLVSSLPVVRDILDLFGIRNRWSR
ncbi:hypothetical protein K502DRAFT_349438 [Neoconidiobolus thromboides FSU 785]|nr:hypothetical protein K502DRAFT_349438 [Neoconidiobolus thromboides FSU 785]